MEAESLLNPSWKRYKIQGENRFIAEVYRNTEQRTASGIVVPVTTRNVPTTGRVLAVSNVFDHEKFPDIKVGASIKVMLGGWDLFDEDKLAFGMAESVIAAYDLNWDSTKDEAAA